MTLQVEQTSASDVQSEQVGMKKARHRPSGRALPFEWQIVALGGAQRRVVRRSLERRNLRTQRRGVPAFGKTPEQSVFDPAAERLAGLQVTQILRGNVDDVIEGGG